LENRVRHFLLVLLSGLLLCGPVHRVDAQSHYIAQAGEGLLEAGSPQFTVLNKESLGLDTPPTDLQLLPDGRVLVVAGQQLAFGDGVRWSVFNQADNDPVTRALTVAVDETGVIYQAIKGGFARVVFGEDGRWRLQKVADWPADETFDRSVPRYAISAGAQWFWHSGSGPILSWRPGEAAHSFGNSPAVAHIFQLHDDFFLCNWSEGTVSVLPARGEARSAPRRQVLTEAFLTCAQAYRDGQIVVGSTVRGLQIFDGRTLRPFPIQGARTVGLRINSVCRTEGGYYAAAVENRGVIFFDEEGRTIESLDRSLDHRLSRVLKLNPGRNGIVWGLLADGIFRVEFPSRVSHYEAVISSGFTTVHPNRADGRLWLMADNRVLRAVYGTDERLIGFEPDTPPDQSTFAMSCGPGMPIAGAEKGGYYRDPAGWTLFAPGSRYLRILTNQPIDGQWLYCAENEIGWLRRSGSGLETRGQPLPGLGRVFNSVPDGHGTVWLEFGSGLVGRVRPGRPADGFPTVDKFGAKDGVPEGWAQAFALDGVVRFNVADRILHLDETGSRLVPDEEFTRAFAGLGTIIGRPGRDSTGRLWISTEKGVHIFTGSLTQLQRVNEPLPAGFQPYYFTFESGGVVWMHSARRLARYDPHVAMATLQPLRALITHVALPASSRVLHPSNDTLPTLSYTDNSLVPHFIATGGTLSTSVAFDVLLDGAGQDWVSAGSAGSTIFNQLKEGHYVLRVRPRMGDQLGEPTSLSFTIKAPWYRTPAAYGTGLLLLLGATVLVARLVTYLERREKLRLENLVARRTRELNETNTRLATQVEEIRTLSQAIQQSPVGVIITDTDGTIFFANPPVCRLSGYDLTELTGQSVRKLRQSSPDDPAGAALAAALQRGDSWDGQLVNRAKDGRLIHVHVTASPMRNTSGTVHHHLYLEEDITAWLAEQERRRRLEGQLFMAQKRESLGTLAGGIAHDFNNILTGILGYNELVQLALGENSGVSQELAGIRSAGQRAKELVNQILTFSRQSNTQLTPLDLSRPVAEALKLIRASTPSTIEIVSTLVPGIARADSTQIHQVMLNLCTNAAHAMRNRPGRLEVRLEPVTLNLAQAGEFSGLGAGAYLRLAISDNGCGMDQALLDRIFDPFFTTKDPGEGTGLGLSIVQSIVTGHHGGLRVRSEPGVGTTFELMFPLSQAAQGATTPPMSAPEGREQEILVVDDESMVTEFVAARLRRLGYRATALLDPRAALEAITTEPQRYTALITDLTMPHMTGVELIRRLHERGLHPPTLIITGYNRNAARADLASVPDILVLQKPFTGEELAQALHRVIEGNRPKGG